VSSVQRSHQECRHEHIRRSSPCADRGGPRGGHRRRDPRLGLGPGHAGLDLGADVGLDLGNAVKPYYGAAAGNKLTALRKAHINAAVGVLEAAKSGNEQSVATAKAAFFANGNQVAAFLHAANPHHWALSDMRTMMRAHLNQVIALAVDQLDGHYAAAIRLYGVYIDHIIDMADMLSTGIIQQFPARF
jgi:hypothetical protein